jgi:hypothetical protein
MSSLYDPKKTLDPEFHTPKMSREEVIARLKHYKPITTRNLLDGTGDIIKMKSLSDNEAAAGGSLIVGFGKYKGDTVDVIKEKDPSYFSWMIENNVAFAKIARRAGLD